MKTSESYEKSFEELKTIIEDIENGDISVDILSEKVQRASELISFCKEKLNATELNVQKMLKDLNKEK